MQVLSETAMGGFIVFVRAATVRERTTCETVHHSDRFLTRGSEMGPLFEVLRLPGVLFVRVSRH